MAAIGLSGAFIIGSFFDPIEVTATAFYKMTILDGGYFFGLFKNTLFFPIHMLIITVCIYSYLAEHCKAKYPQYVSEFE